MKTTSGLLDLIRRRAIGVRIAALGAAWLVWGGGGGVARAEPPRFLAELDRNQVIVGEPFVYQVTLSVGNDQISDYRPPDFKGLRVLSTPGAPNQSTQMQFGGAGMFVQISYSWRYEVAAAQKGTITIGPARVRVNGQDLRSSTVTVSSSNASASAGPPPLSPPASQASDPSAAAGAAAPGGAAVSPPPEAAQGGSFIRLVADKQKVFVGEAVAATWYLYMNQPADKYDTQVEPHTEGFWTEDVIVPSRRGGLVLTQEMVQGHVYQVGTVLKKALFPLQAGPLTITPMEAEISRSDFFGNAVRSQRVRSTPTVIDVLPLPKAGQPAGFDAANVGIFTLAARVDRAQVAVGEAVTLTIEVGGRGNLRKLVLPAIPKLDGWKAYDPRVNVVVDPASGVTGTKTAEVLLLPERPGPVTLPALVLETFDPDARRYARVQTSPITLTATGDPTIAARGAGGASGPTAGGTFSENVIAGEIRPLHARTQLRRDLGSTFFRTRGFVGVLGLPPLGFALVVVAFRIRDRLGRDTGSRRRRRARQKVRAHLAAADGYRQRGETGAFFIEIDRVIREALTSKLGCPVKGLRWDELRTLLGARGLPAAEADRVIAVLEECDRARFAPGGVDAAGQSASLRAALDGASDLIDLIEKAPIVAEART
jgi:BatD DUF11 like domain